MQYPLELTFKIVALAPQLRVTNAAGETVCYVKQKLFKLKEAVEVFTDETRTEKLCEIKADRIIDFSAKYTFYTNAGEAFGAIRRKGMRSLWRAHYEILDHETPEYEIREENGWIKVMDSVFGEIPIIGAFAGYFFNPTYLIQRIDTGEVLVCIKKQPAFWEGKFILEQVGAIDDGDQLRIMLSTLMMVVLERSRG
ncbi:MAG: hypothetical protein P1U81_14560 [Verrucomicrobiales bacterium]|jgi:uncharacterized protein YxjI|nr:hypothetical protein [Verrucomicrobiales bacterium]